MKALLFPGQGSQFVGMGSDLFKQFDYVKKIFSDADDFLKKKISKIILEGPEEELKLTQNTQPAIMIVSYSYFLVLQKELGVQTKHFKYFAGHSLGEYSALVSSGSINFENALFLLNERGKAMQNSVPVGKGGMLAVLGSDVSSIENLIKNTNKDGICEIANDNSIGQIIVSGDIKSINLFKLTLDKSKIKNLTLPVSAPFHCSLMRNASELMEKKINSVNFSELEVPIVANVTAKEEKSPNSIKSLLVKQIFSKVRWRESMEYMSNNGVKTFIEVGPGKVLTGLAKRIVKDKKIININTLDNLNLLKDEF
ncbi:MAG: [acyl-carrier-protein] S-malonyltransferase [Candidatus Pelagibacter sp.]|nr:[acyl-carrier-protein] S-malonyltransferase [Candidatus Pelagibacter sp.]OUW24162.1 MAG: [acyl-carrier-protein] S-malonyltransferase [Rickettsiales bacterium TMED174]